MGWQPRKSAFAYFLAVSIASLFSTSGGVSTRNDDNSTDQGTKRPETTSLQGTLRGVNIVTHHNRVIYGFKGIPYAEPPVGNLRFKPPIAAGTWNGTFDAVNDSSKCPQTIEDGVTVTGDEDCLYLHVYTPKLPAIDNSMLLPVIVYFFGGRYRVGTPNPERYSPNFLLDKDVILVVPNFRIGLLGYLTTGDEVSPGNYGLKDIVLALKWVQDNIQYFGGDRNQVTIFGHSSGAMSVSFMALSNLTNGLFHKSITNSGSSLNLQLTPPRELFVNRTIQLGEYLSCPTNTSTLLIDCLRGFNASQLLKANSLFYLWNTEPASIWLPTTEPDIEGAFLTDSPRNLFAAGKVRDVPWLSIVVRDEGLVLTLMFNKNPDLFEDFLDKIDIALPEILGYVGAVDNVTAYTTALKAYYLNDLTANRSLLLTNLTELLGDGIFYYPVYCSLQRQTTFAKSPLYFGSFEYRGIFSNTYRYTGSTSYTGISHGDDLIYLFKNQNHLYGPSNFEFSAVELSMVDTMVQLWTSFAINGTPTTVDSYGGTIWEPYSLLNNYLRIGNGSDTALEMQHDLYIERMKFWDELTASTLGSCRS